MRRFKSICHKSYLGFKDDVIAEAGRIYDVVPDYHRVKMDKSDNLSHYNIYDGNIPIIVYRVTEVSGLSPRSFIQYFYTQEEMRNINIDKILNEKI